MLEGFLTVTGVLLAAGGAGTEWAAQRSATRMAVPEARLADLAEEFANIAAAVLRKVEIRTAALETLVRQAKPVQNGVARAMGPAPPGAPSAGRWQRHPSRWRLGCPSRHWSRRWPPSPGRASPPGRLPAACR